MRHHVVDLQEPADRPLHRRPLDGLDVILFRGQLAGPRGQPAVQHRHRLAEGAQQPPRPGGDRAAGVVVDDDRAVGRDTQAAERGRHLGGGRQRMTAALGARRQRQVGVEIDPAGARDVASLIRGASRSPVEVPPGVEHFDLADVFGKPLPRHDLTRQRHHGAGAYGCSPGASPNSCATIAVMSAFSRRRERAVLCPARQNVAPTKASITTSLSTSVVICPACARPRRAERRTARRQLETPVLAAARSRVGRCVGHQSRQGGDRLRPGDGVDDQPDQGADVGAHVAGRGNVGAGGVVGEHAPVHEVGLRRVATVDGRAAHAGPTGDLVDGELGVPDLDEQRDGRAADRGVDGRVALAARTRLARAAHG